jgi:hypothetical protein
LTCRGFSASGRKRKMIQDYGNGTHVRCRKCTRTIFVEGPFPLAVHDGKWYLELKCAAGTCGGVFEYEENELEIHGRLNF